MTFSDNTMFSGEFKDGKPSVGRILAPDGSVRYDGGLLNGRPEG